MIKPVVISLIFVSLMIYGIFSYAGESQNYWKNVGPTWDRLLNPINYNE